MFTHPIALGISVAFSLVSIAGGTRPEVKSMGALVFCIGVAAVSAAISVWP